MVYLHFDNRCRIAASTIIRPNSIKLAYRIFNEVFCVIIFFWSRGLNGLYQINSGRPKYGQKGTPNLREESGKEQSPRSCGNVEGQGKEQAQPKKDPWLPFNDCRFETKVSDEILQSFAEPYGSLVKSRQYEAGICYMATNK